MVIKSIAHIEELIGYPVSIVFFVWKSTALEYQEEILQGTILRINPRHGLVMLEVEGFDPKHQLTTRSVYGVKFSSILDVSFIT